MRMNRQEKNTMEHARPAPIRELDSNLKVISRRSFFGVLVGLASIAISALLAVPLLRSMLYPLYSAGALSKWSKIGLVDSLPPAGSPPVRARITFRKLHGWRVTSTTESVYVERAANGKIRVLSAICPHLGCTVRWRAATGDFFCPCHHSVFGSDGTLLKGPAKRGMDPLPTRQQQGDLLVRFEFFREDVPDRDVVASS